MRKLPGSRKNHVRIVLFSMFFTVLLSPVVTTAQVGKVNFSGNWTLNESKSNLGERGFRGASKFFAITHAGINMTTVRTSLNRDGEEMKTTEKITLDGKKCENSANNRTKTSTATWSDDGKVLTINSVMVFNRQGQSTEMKSKEVWKLDDGGAVLTINSTSASQRGEMNITFVYEKK